MAKTSAALLGWTRARSLAGIDLSAAGGKASELCVGCQQRPAAAADAVGPAHPGKSVGVIRFASGEKSTCNQRSVRSTFLVGVASGMVSVHRLSKLDMFAHFFSRLRTPCYTPKAVLNDTRGNRSAEGHGDLVPSSWGCPRFSG